MIISTESSTVLTIEKDCSFEISGLKVNVKSYLCRIADVHYFNVICDSGINGILRVGTIGGALSREIEVRKSLGAYKLISELLVCEEVHAKISLHNEPVSNPEELIFKDDEIIAEDIADTGSEYLEEDFIEEDTLIQPYIVTLSELPNEENSLQTWLNQEHPTEQILSVLGQICQVFRYAQQHGWGFIQIFPRFIFVESVIKFVDLTGIYPLGEKLKYGLMGDYCPPEIAYSSDPVNEKISTFALGALLYHAIHHYPPSLNSDDFKINPIPKIYQILSTCLSLNPDDRYSLDQLINLIVKMRQEFSFGKVDWQVFGGSTVGLQRFHNEDNYGYRQLFNSTSNSMVLGVVADGMGGEANGELASKLAVETLLESQFPNDLTGRDTATKWLIELVKKANEVVSNDASGGSTTLSAVFANGRELAIAHVGDSRIFLLRNGCICQLSEDHSYPALLLASGQITYEESLTHPDMNRLTKFIGTKRLSDGYIQDLTHFSIDKTLNLKDDDILILCSDGVWDLVPPDTLAEIFSSNQTLKFKVNQVINSVLDKGAHDNATILSMSCSVSKST